MKTLREILDENGLLLCVREWQPDLGIKILRTLSTEEVRKIEERSVELD